MAFTGFPKEGVSWFDGLVLTQSREWFQANKRGYEVLWLEPMKALLDELKAPLSKIYGKKLAPPKIFRLNRDVRFSKDKRPYKTHIAGLLSFEGGAVMEGPAALYLQLGTENYYAYGFYFLETPKILRLRKALLDEKKGAALVKLVSRAEAAGLELDSSEAFKRPPPGVAKDHPRVELLKKKGLALGSADFPKSVRFGPKLKDFLLAQAKIAAPVVKWGFQQKL